MFHPELTNQRVLPRFRIRRFSSGSYLVQRLLHILAVYKALIALKDKRCKVSMQVVAGAKYECEWRIAQVLQVHDVTWASAEDVLHHAGVVEYLDTEAVVGIRSKRGQRSYDVPLPADKYTVANILIAPQEAKKPRSEGSCSSVWASNRSVNPATSSAVRILIGGFGRACFIASRFDPWTLSRHSTANFRSSSLNCPLRQQDSLVLWLNVNEHALRAIFCDDGFSSGNGRNPIHRNAFAEQVVNAHPVERGVRN